MKNHNGIVTHMRRVVRTRIVIMLEEGITKAEACEWVFRRYPNGLKKYYSRFIQTYWLGLI